MSETYYKCLKANHLLGTCQEWQQVTQTPLPLSKSEANELTIGIIGFMVFVYIWKQIINSAK